ncbi:helix-turn-helix domain-containing protein [Falsiroseomonas sp. CW058]|uniref:helix-turn-helix domain-containing protein n=1 Tax=Falsiroseomonas sp. CW058 TaxID=3388664 RepID=UPI003D3169E4
MATKVKAPATAREATKRAATRAQGKVATAKRAPTQPRVTTEDEFLATAHALGAALNRVGALDAATVRDLDALCLPLRPQYGGADVRRIRAAARMSQPVFARLLGVDKSAVAQWERGAKRPSGPAARLLEVLDSDRAEESPVVRLRRAMTPPT